MNTSSQLPTSETPNFINFCETLQIPEAHSSFQTCLLLSFASLTNGQSHETDPPKLLLLRAQQPFGTEVQAKIRAKFKNQKTHDSGFEPESKRLAKRISLIWYLEPKWLRCLRYFKCHQVLTYASSAEKAKNSKAMESNHCKVLKLSFKTFKLLKQGRTNRRNTGKISVDRSTKTTLALTIPGCN